MTHEVNASKAIEAAVELGFSLTEAVAKAAGCGTVTELARQLGFRRAEVGFCLLGYHQRVYPEIRDAICQELEISREFLDEKIEDQAARTAAAAESA